MQHAGVMASCVRLHLPDCCKLHAEFPKVKAERCGDLPACSCVSATAAHLTPIVLGRCCSALGWSGRPNNDEGRYLQHQDRSTVILGYANTLVLRVCLINRL